MTTHDLPPTAGYLAGEHVALRDRLACSPARSTRSWPPTTPSRTPGWTSAARRAGCSAEAQPTSGRPIEALHRYLTRTPSRLIGVALADAVGDRRTQNQPGTIDEYPNWRVPLTGPDQQLMLLEDVFASTRGRAGPRCRRAGCRHSVGNR